MPRCWHGRTQRSESFPTIPNMWGLASGRLSRPGVKAGTAPSVQGDQGAPDSSAHISHVGPWVATKHTYSCTLLHELSLDAQQPVLGRLTCTAASAPWALSRCAQPPAPCSEPHFCAAGLRQKPIPISGRTTHRRVGHGKCCRMVPVKKCAPVSNPASCAKAAGHAGSCCAQQRAGAMFGPA